MFGIKKTLLTIITVVGFLALAALSSVWYGDNGEQKAKLDQKKLYQESLNVINATIQASERLANFSLKRNVGTGDKIKTELSSMKAIREKIAQEEKVFASQKSFKDYLFREWAKRRSEKIKDNNSLSFQSDATGNLILILKNGRSYKIPFLGQLLGK